jgi:predicted MPP superfamily phosphohydrolase
MRIAAIADIHCNTTSHDLVRSLFAQMAQRADIVLLCGDLVDYGLPEEAAVLAKEISSLKIPTLAVLGNHEYESGKEDEVRRILTVPARRYSMAMRAK